MNDATDQILRTGDVEVRGRLPWSSNATFLVDVCTRGSTTQAVYKPLRGERPLWDFPRGLYKRETAAFHVSEALGWQLVPVTVTREDGPLGEGSLQAFVDAEFEEHYFTLYEDERFHGQLRRICLFDLIINNTDRKSGHCLLDRSGHIWAIDNGLSFHEELKLRTVIWEFGGQPIDQRDLDDVERFVAGGLPAELDALLGARERTAIIERSELLLTERVYPTDPSGRRYPWPLV